MIKKIIVGFESVEFAEFAAKALKSKASGIYSVTVSAPKASSGKDFVPFLFATRSEANFAPNFLPEVFNDNEGFELIHDNYAGRPEPSHSAVMEVICDAENEKEIRGILVNHGGMKI